MDYANFLENAEDFKTLNELLDWITESVRDKKLIETGIQKGSVGTQYEIFKKNGTLDIRDNYTKSIVTISANSKDNFVFALRKELSNRLKEMDFVKYLTYESSIEED